MNIIFTGSGETKMNDLIEDIMQSDISKENTPSTQYSNFAI